MDEKEWVERKALVEEIREAQRRLESCDDIKWERNKPYFKGMAWAHRIVLDAPAADVVEVRHGEWIIKINYKTPVSHAHIRKEKLYICPYCGKDYRQHMNFCGNCGVKMDGATDNNVGGKREG